MGISLEQLPVDEPMHHTPSLPPPPISPVPHCATLVPLPADSNTPESVEVAAPPLPLMGMAEMVIELVPLVLPVTVLLFGWFAAAWLE